MAISKFFGRIGTSRSPVKVPAGVRPTVTPSRLMSLMNGVGRNTPARPVFGSTCVSAGSNCGGVRLDVHREVHTHPLEPRLGQRHDADFDGQCQVLQAAKRLEQVLDLADDVGGLVHHQGVADVEELDLAGAAHAVPRIGADHARQELDELLVLGVPLADDRGGCAERAGRLPLGIEPAALARRAFRPAWRAWWRAGRPGGPWRRRPRPPRSLRHAAHPLDVGLAGRRLAIIFSKFEYSGRAKFGIGVTRSATEKTLVKSRPLALRFVVDLHEVVLDHEAQARLLQGEGQEVPGRDRLAGLHGHGLDRAEPLGVERGLVDDEREFGYFAQVVDGRFERRLAELDRDRLVELELDVVLGRAFASSGGSRCPNRGGSRAAPPRAGTSPGCRCRPCGPMRSASLSPSRTNFSRSFLICSASRTRALIFAISYRAAIAGSSGSRCLGLHRDLLGAGEVLLLDELVVLADEAGDLGLALFIGGVAAGDDLAGVARFLVHAGDGVGLPLHHAEHLEPALDRPQQQGDAGGLQVGGADAIGVIDEHLDGEVGLAAAEGGLGIGLDLEAVRAELLELDLPQRLGLGRDAIGLLRIGGQPRDPGRRWATWECRAITGGSPVGVPGSGGRLRTSRERRPTHLVEFGAAGGHQLFPLRLHVGGEQHGVDEHEDAHRVVVVAVLDGGLGGVAGAQCVDLLLGEPLGVDRVQEAASLILDAAVVVGLQGELGGHVEVAARELEGGLIEQLAAGNTARGLDNRLQTGCGGPGDRLDRCVGRDRVGAGPGSSRSAVPWRPAELAGRGGAERGAGILDRPGEEPERRRDLAPAVRLASAFS